jgi:predicted dehydrogenase
MVLNLTTPVAHADVTLAALAAGKHVFSEKPLALTLADADRIALAARERGLSVACAPSIMLGAPQRTAWRWIREGRLGAVHEIILSVTTPGHEAWHANPRYFYQAGAGPMLDLGVYPLTLATTILGPIVRVWGQAGMAIPEREVATGPRAGERFSAEIAADHVTGFFQCERGAIGTLHTSYAVAQTRLPPVEIQGTLGSLWIDDFHRFDAAVRVCLRGESAWREIALLGPEAAPNWARAIVDLAEAVQERRPPRASAEQAAHVLEVALGIEQSAREGTRPVEITRRFAPPVPLDEPIEGSDR